MTVLFFLHVTQYRTNYSWDWLQLYPRQWKGSMCVESISQYWICRRLTLKMKMYTVRLNWKWWIIFPVSFTATVVRTAVSVWSERPPDAGQLGFVFVSMSYVTSQVFRIFWLFFYIQATMRWAVWCPMSLMWNTQRWCIHSPSTLSEVKKNKKKPLIVDIFFTLLYLFISILKGYIYLSIYYFSDAHRMFFKNLACCWTNFYFGFWCNVFLLTFGCYLTLYPFVCFSPFNPFLGLGGVKPIPAVGECWVGR